MAVKTIAVYGATGAQGGALSRSLLKNNKDFTVRAITRNPDSPKAQALAKLGAEVVRADGHDQTQMRAALQGVWGFWLNTDHHDPAVSQPGGMSDSELGRSLITLASECGVKVFIYSTCDSSAQYTNGKVLVPGMEDKYKVFQFACRPDHQFESVIGAFPGWYMENFLSAEYSACFGGFPTQADAEGYLTFSSPLWGGSGKVPFIAVEDDFGDIIQGLFLDPQAFDKQIVPVYSDEMTFDDLTACFTKITGKKARYVPQKSADDFPTHGLGVLEEIADVFRYTQATGGRFFGQPNSSVMSLRLKQAAVRANGEGSAKLRKTIDFLKGHFNSL